MIRRIYSHWAPLFLVLIWLVLIIQNYTPHTILSGWDTLHPEFNFPEYFKRVIFSVWQDHQGLGAVASQAHASELPRLIIYYLSSLVIPKEILRYAYIFACLLIGPLGVYYFLKKLGKIPAFLASLFYILNLVTVQQFFVPFEMFATHYATLPWIFYFAVEYLRTKSSKTLLFFALVNLLASSIAHTATLWYAYILIFSVFLFFCFWVDKTKAIRKASLILVAVAILVNLFWILPNFYFIINHGKEVGNSKISTLFTGEAFAQNESFGNIPDLLLFKNFLFNWGQYVGDNKFDPLLSEWQKHLDNPLISFLGYVFFAVILTGVINSIRLKSKIAIPMLSIFLLSVFFWLNVNPPLGFIFQFVQDHFPLFREALRFPFTKFSIILIFAGSFFFAFGILFLNEKLARYYKNSRALILGLMAVFLVIYSFPAFKGNLIDPYMRVQIPKEYFQLFDWFNKQPDGRIASFPIHSFWGWEYYDFNQNNKIEDPHKIYQGAGFLWFGIRQPILEREFDRWNSLNEQYYREMSQAVYTENSRLFKDVLSKYDISYLLIDKNIVAPQANSKVLFFDELESLAGQTGLSRIAEFGKIIVYKVPSNNSVYIVNGAKTISPKLSSGYEDFAYEKYGPYITPPGKNLKGDLFPLRDIIDNENRVSKDLIRLTQNGIYVDLKNTQVSNLSLPKYEDLEDNFAVDVVAQREDNLLRVIFKPKFPKSLVPLEANVNLPQDQNNFLLSINQKYNFILNNLAQNTPLDLETVFLKTSGINSISLYQDKNDFSAYPDFSNTNFSLNPCSGPTSGTFSVNTNTDSFTLSASNSNPCLDVPLSGLISSVNPSPEYLLGVSFVNKNSNDSSFCLSSAGACVNYDLKNIYTAPLSSNKNYYYFGLKNQDISDTNLRFSLDSPSGSSKTTFSDIRLNLKIPFYHLEFTKDVLSLSLDTLKNSKDKNFLIPFSGDSQLSRDITSELRTTGDCQADPGLISPPKKEIVKQSFKNYIRYEASEGSFCDHFSYRNLSSKQAYLIVIQSRNVKGLPIRLCITNPITKRCDIYTHLTSSHDFTNDVFLLPPRNIQGLMDSSGFDININNFGIKNIPAVNDIASINVIPFPYNWLSRIESDPTPATPTTEQVSSTKLNKSIYLANLNGENGVLTISQSFENGWHAYETGNTFLPFLFGKELNNHVLVDNWANGWVLDGYKGKVAIIFLPQYLEYLGFIILIFTFGLVISSERYIRK